MSKTEQMRANLSALELVFRLGQEGRKATTDEKEVLTGYVGFGGLSEILIDPRENFLWTPANQRLRPLVMAFHEMLEKENPGRKEEYVQSARNSVLTGFYTPLPIIRAFSEALREAGISPNSVLDPSAGSGRFMEVLRTAHTPAEVVMYEKDLLTGLLLSAKSTDRVRIEGFENTGGTYANRFDLVTSNIPFGSIPVFDPYFARKGEVENQATSLIHNYFFLKSIELARPGGLVALITTDSFANTAGNRIFRENLLRKASLVSAVRLPHTLFQESGTEVGSDFIVVQKRNKPSSTFSPEEKLFLETTVDLYESAIAPSNGYFDAFPERIIHTDRELSTNQYGKPALIYSHSGGSQKVGEELAAIFANDFNQNINRILYESKANQVQRSKDTPAGQLSLFSQPGNQELPPTNPVPFTGTYYNHLVEGSVVAQEGKLGRLATDEAGTLVCQPLRLTTRQRDLWQSLLNIRESYFQLVHQERDRGQEAPVQREQLNRSYDGFRDRFGCLKDKANLDTVLLDPTGRQLL